LFSYRDHTTTGDSVNFHIFGPKGGKEDVDDSVPEKRVKGVYKPTEEVFEEFESDGPNLTESTGSHWSTY